MKSRVIWFGVVVMAVVVMQIRVQAQEVSTMVLEEPDAFKQLFGDELINAAGEKVSVDTLAGKKIGIYFSAHWCPPCRMFTPKLVKTYNEMQAADKPFEIVFLSGDRSAKAMKEYMESTKMPWLAVPFGDAHKDNVGKMFNVRSIPTLVILGADGKLVTLNGRSDVDMYGPKAFDKW